VLHSRTDTGILPFPSSHTTYYSTPSYDSASLPPFRGSTHRIITASSLTRDTDLIESAPTGRLSRSGSGASPVRLKEALDKLSNSSASPKLVRTSAMMPSRWNSARTSRDSSTEGVSSEGLSIFVMLICFFVTVY